ncbi:MAG: AEC family transporter [Oscillibacter sp.]|nr:AEC family transporter [Oscillibacter sp.]
MISLLLLKEIARLLVIMLMGWGLVKTKLLRSEDSRVLSVILIYVTYPCVIINAFQMERGPDTLRMLALSLLSAVTLTTFSILFGSAVGRALRLDRVETTSVAYSNAGNLTIPLVSAVLGPQWVMFVSVYFMTQTLWQWTHGRILMSGEKKISLRALVTNINIIAIVVGVALFFCGVRLPFLGETFSAVGAMVGPVAMLIAGMLLAEVTKADLLRYRNLWKVTVLRLVVIPFLGVCLAKYSGAAALAPQGETILLVSLLSAITPSPNLTVQFCQMFGGDAKYAGLINLVTMLLCIFTIPLLVAFYQM